MDIKTIKTIYIPSEKSPDGYVILRFIKRESDGKEFVGIGLDEWIVKHGLSMDQFKIFNNEESK